MAKIIARTSETAFLVAMTSGELNTLAGWCAYPSKDWGIGDKFDPDTMFAQLERINDHKKDIQATAEKLRRMAVELENCLDVELISVAQKKVKK